MIRNSALAVTLLALGLVGISYIYTSNSTETEVVEQPIVGSENVEENPMWTNTRLLGPDFHSTSFDSAVGFSIPKGYGHLKIYFENYGSSPVSLTLHHNESSYEYWPNGKTVAAGGTFKWISYDNGYASGMRSGTYSFTVTGTGSKVNAEVWGKTATATGDIKPTT